MVLLFILADIFFILSIYIKRVSIKNIFPFIYFAFVNLYTISVYFVYISKTYDNYGVELSKVLSNKYIVNQVLMTATIAIFTFAILQFKSSNIIEQTVYKDKIPVSIYRLIYIVIFPIALYLNKISNWTYGAREGILPSLAAYSRNILTVLCIGFFISNKIKTKEKIFWLFLFMIVTYVGTQRTNMLIVIIAFVYCMKNKQMIVKMLVFGVLALLILGSVRNGVSAINLIYPILGEGILGSWGLLQAITANRVIDFEGNRILALFVPTINWIGDIFGFQIDMPQLSDIVVAYGETYYPMGGFFYLSDAYLVHPVIGSVVYTILIYFLYRFFLRKFYEEHSLKYLTGLSLMFATVKATFSSFFAMLVFHVLICYLLKLIEVLMKRK